MGKHDFLHPHTVSTAFFIGIIIRLRIFMCNFALYKYTHNYMTDIASYFPITNPTIIFFVVLLIILFAPIIMGKLRIPTS